MKTNVTEVVELVLLGLDESPVLLDDAVEYGSPDFDLRELARRLMPMAAERVLLSASADEIAESVSLPGEPVRLSEGGVTRTLLPLPDHCLRVVYIRMSDWDREEVAPLSRATAGLRRHWASRRGSAYGSPAFVLARHQGNAAIEIFGTGGDSTVADSGYLPRPEISGDWLHFPSPLTFSLVGELVRMIKDIRK